MKTAKPSRRRRSQSSRRIAAAARHSAERKPSAAVEAREIDRLPTVEIHGALGRDRIAAENRVIRIWLEQVRSGGHVGRAAIESAKPAVQLVFDRRTLEIEAAAVVCEVDAAALLTAFRNLPKGLLSSCWRPLHLDRLTDAPHDAATRLTAKRWFAIALVSSRVDQHEVAFADGIFELTSAQEYVDSFNRRMEPEGVRAEMREIDLASLRFKDGTSLVAAN